MKKVISSILIMAVCLMGLMATGNKEVTNNSKTVTLSFMGWAQSPLETQAVKEGIATFEAQNPNIKIQYTPSVSGDDYKAKLLSSIAGGSAPDVFFINARDYRIFAGKGVLLDITNRFLENFPLDDFITSSRTIMQIDGHVYGISSCTVSPIVFYNKDIFDKKGIPYPSSDPNHSWTIDQFRETAKKLTGDGVFGVYGMETVQDTLYAQLLSGGAKPFSDDYTKSTIDSPETRKVLETIKAIRVKDGSAPSAATLDGAGMNAQQMLMTGRVAMLVDGSWSLQQLTTTDFNVGIAPLPSYGNVLTTGTAHLHAISATTNHPEEAWKFVTFLSGMDYQGKLSQEGLWLPNHYSLWADGEDGIDGWYDEQRLGPYYKQMGSYLRDAKVNPAAMQKTSRLSDILKEETDKYFKENEPIDIILARLQNRSNEAIAESLE
ncbi:MAG: sugar ABC transporter substrate-binding protein [Peptostreptococcaceae bacterium]|nr:sugar ABC transporter substrate-binding protein [Peptostreptococcaceae bacterium]